MKLNAKELDAALKGKKPLKKGRHGDGRGLYLMVTSSTAMSWVFIFSDNGKRRDVGIGSFTGTGRTVRLSLAQARAKADELRVDLSKGILPAKKITRTDVKKQREAEKQAVLFSTVLDEFLVTTEKNKGWKITRADGLSGQRHAMQRSVEINAPQLLTMPVADITTKDILAVISEKWPSPTMDKLRSLIERVLDLAEFNGQRTGKNPAAWKNNLEVPLSNKPKTKTSRKSMAPAALPAFFAKLKALDTTESRSLMAVILTATRTDETREMKWSEIDHEKGLWNIPAERMKAKVAQFVPLSSTMLEILAAQPKIVGNDYVWAGKGKGKPISDSAHKTLLRKLGVTSEEATVHGFRGTFSNWVSNATTFDTETREFALAHALDPVVGAYLTDTAVGKRTLMMQAWNDFAEGKSDGKVLKLVRAEALAEAA